LNGWNLIGDVELSEREKEMDEHKWRYRSMQRNGGLIEWTAETLPGGCIILRIQKISESWERRHYPGLFAPRFKGGKGRERP